MVVDYIDMSTAEAFVRRMFRHMKERNLPNPIDSFYKTGDLLECDIKPKAMVRHFLLTMARSGHFFTVWHDEGAEDHCCICECRKMLRDHIAFSNQLPVHRGGGKPPLEKYVDFKRIKRDHVSVLTMVPDYENYRLIASLWEFKLGKLRRSIATVAITAHALARLMFRRQDLSVENALAELCLHRSINVSLIMFPKDVEADEFREAEFAFPTKNGMAVVGFEKGFDMPSIVTWVDNEKLHEEQFNSTYCCVRDSLEFVESLEFIEGGPCNCKTTVDC